MHHALPSAPDSRIESGAASLDERIRVVHDAQQHMGVDGCAT